MFYGIGVKKECDFYKIETQVLHFVSPQENIKCVQVGKENMMLEEAVLLQGRISNCTRCWIFFLARNGTYYKEVLL